MATTNICTTFLLEKNNKRYRYCWQSINPKSLPYEKNINWYWETKFETVYSLLVYRDVFTPIPQKYFNELFKTDSFHWKQIYLLPRCSSLFFQYKILNNVFYRNKKLFTFRKSTSPLCPFCKLSDETVLHLFYECNIIQNLWNDLILFFEIDFTPFDLTPQAAFLDLRNVDSKLLLVQITCF